MQRVTKIIGSVFPFPIEHIPEGVLQASQDFGTAVHETVRLYLKGTLNLATLDPVLVKYLEQFKKWQKDTNFKVMGCSKRLVSKKYNFTGELDLWGEDMGILTIPDIKTTATISKTVGVQLAGYEILLREYLKTAGKIKRRILRLHDDRYDYLPLDDKGDLSVFLSCLCIHNFKKRIGYENTKT